MVQVMPLDLSFGEGEGEVFEVGEDGLFDREGVCCGEVKQGIGGDDFFKDTSGCEDVPCSGEVEEGEKVIEALHEGLGEGGSHFLGRDGGGGNGGEPAVSGGGFGEEVWEGGVGSDQE